MSVRTAVQRVWTAVQRVRMAVQRVRVVGSLQAGPAAAHVRTLASSTLSSCPLSFSLQLIGAADP